MRYRQRQKINLENRVVTTSPDSWVAPSAVLVGDVDLFERVSIWHNCVLRGDLNSIRIGAFSNVQDRTVIHAARSSPTGLPAATTVGRSVTIGQGCVLRSVIIEDECIIGDKCILMEGSMMENHSILQPGSVLPPGRRIPSGQLWGGNPAQFVRNLSKDEKAAISEHAKLVYPMIDGYQSEVLPETLAYRDAEALRAAMKPDTALVKGADLEADGPR
jgi:carbonic anhydrase/acetyltransferase-like protein (isoleucine patch superfamily)